MTECLESNIVLELSRIEAHLLIISVAGVSALTNALGKNNDGTVTNPGPGLRKTNNLLRGPAKQTRAAGSRNINTSSEKNNNNNSHSKERFRLNIRLTTPKASKQLLKIHCLIISTQTF